MGGSDQWGNITAGIELIGQARAAARRTDWSFPLITTASGMKFGKTEGGNVWLDPAQTSPFRFYQFWLNTDDRDVERYLKLFTFLALEQIARPWRSRRRTGKRAAQRAAGAGGDRVVHGEQRPSRRRSRARRCSAADSGPVDTGDAALAASSPRAATFRSWRWGPTAGEFVDLLVTGPGSHRRRPTPGAAFRGGVLRKRRGDQKWTDVPPDGVTLDDFAGRAVGAPEKGKEELREAGVGVSRRGRPYHRLRRVPDPRLGSQQSEQSPPLPPVQSSARCARAPTTAPAATRRDGLGRLAESSPSRRGCRRGRRRPRHPAGQHLARALPVHRLAIFREQVRLPDVGLQLLGRERRHRDAGGIRRAATTGVGDPRASSTGHDGLADAERGERLLQIVESSWERCATVARAPCRRPACARAARAAPGSELRQHVIGHVLRASG